MATMNFGRADVVCISGVDFLLLDMARHAGNVHRAIDQEVMPVPEPPPVI